MTVTNILITGASRGIGAATVEALGSEQVRVAGHATTDAEGLIGCDLSRPGAGRELWQRALAALDGRIDVLVNNAGVFEANPIDAGDDEWDAQWARGHAINLKAAADLSREAVRHWQSRRSGGRIVNVASRAGQRGDSPEHWHYAAAKAGMIGMTKTIARAYAHENILAFAVTPGFTATGAVDEYLASRGGAKLLADIPLGRPNTAGEVANVIAYLALSAPAAMTGATLDINGASYVR